METRVINSDAYWKKFEFMNPFFGFVTDYWNISDLDKLLKDRSHADIPPEILALLVAISSETNVIFDYEKYTVHAIFKKRIERPRRRMLARFDNGNTLATKVEYEQFESSRIKNIHFREVDGIPRLCIQTRHTEYLADLEYVQPLLEYVSKNRLAVSDYKEYFLRIGGGNYNGYRVRYRV